jgi:7-keto-8-aminopelargonate synthetase-like enzyme
MRELRQVGRTYILWNDRKLSCFAGCDYFRLASHPAVLAAVQEGLEQEGLNVAASRLTTGNHPLYSRLEAALAEFFAAPAALAASHGYAANLMVAQALHDQFSHVLMDARAHPSLRDAARFFSCPVLEFKHRDPGDLARRLGRLRGRPKPILLTDGLFGQDGQVAPLREYLKVLPAQGQILVDDAHAAGVLGATGKGTLEYAGVSRRRVVQTVALSKGFGVYGGAVLCSRSLRQTIIRRSSLFAGSTPLPLPLVNAALQAIEILRRDQSLRCRLSHNVSYVQTSLRARGLVLPPTPGPIIALVPGRAAEAAAIRRGLLAHGVFPSFIRYPGGPGRGYFRFAISSEHSREQLDALVAGLQISL